jgi:inhibitor of cysteine peptidase
LSVVLVALVAACGTPQADETPSDEVIYSEANVEEVEVLLMESFPIQVAVIARGNLPDGCTEIDDVETSFDEESKTFSVEVTTVRDADAVCTQALVPFEERVDLDVRGLPAGTYTVDVNGVRETFTFDVDNEAPESSAAEIPWEEAKELIMRGEVAQVTQLHSLEVTLELKDGRRLVTMEPGIDAVFDVVDACGEPCEDIVLATE